MDNHAEFKKGILFALGGAFIMGNSTYLLEIHSRY